MALLMEETEKQQKREQFKKALKDFAAELQSYVSDDAGQWSVKGFIDVFKNVYTISADTKIVSKVLEIHLFPKILSFAEKNGLKVVLAECQNWYPDFSFVGLKDDDSKFAVDLKTTYRSTRYPGHVNGFTLGSHGAYFINRKGKKNIQFPYAEYLGHFCLGTMYTRNVSEELSAMSVYSVAELDSNPVAAELGDLQKAADPALRERLKRVERLRSIASVVSDLRFFACEKWELAGDQQGSKNTANIGSITWIEDVVSGNGVFKDLGEAMFDEYWMNYGNIKDSEGKTITRLEQYLKFRGLDFTKINKKKPRRIARPEQGASRGPAEPDDEEGESQ